MVKEIVKDESFLQIPSTPATEEDLQTAQDLLDTLLENTDRCVGLAANMIGVSKRIIAIEDEGKFLVMLKPEIVKWSQPYFTEEACLSDSPQSPQFSISQAFSAASCSGVWNQCSPCSRTVSFP